MKVLIDTSVIISFLINDEHTQKAQDIFAKVFEGKIVAFIAPLNVIEVCSAMRRNMDKQSAQVALSKLNEWIENGIIQLAQQTQAITATACSIAMNDGLKGTDALIAATAHGHQLKLATFDKEIKMRTKLDFYE